MGNRSSTSNTTTELDEGNEHSDPYTCESSSATGDEGMTGKENCTRRNGNDNDCMVSSSVPSIERGTEIESTHTDFHDKAPASKSFAKDSLKRNVFESVALESIINDNVPAKRVRRKRCHRSDEEMKKEETKCNHVQLDHNYSTEQSTKIGRALDQIAFHGSYGRGTRLRPHTNYKDLITFFQKCSKLQIINWLQAMDILSSSYLCPKCSNFMSLKRITSSHASSDQYSWLCSRRMNNIKHNVSRTIRRGSWMQHSNLTLEEVITLTYFWCTNSKQCSSRYELLVSNSTAVDWYAFCREVCLDVCIKHRTPIGGPGIIVEIDECKVGKRKFHRGKRVEGQWIFGGCEKNDSSKCFMIPVADRTKVTLLGLIESWIRPGSVIMSDCWKSYNDIEKLKQNYTHMTVNHSKEFKSKEGTCTNTIEGTWRHMKRSIPLSVRSSSYESYLAEYMWRKKNSGNDLFHAFLRDITTLYKPLCHD